MEKKELSRIRLWLFDLDGTLYLGERIFSFTGPLLDAIRKSGGKYLFLTNNSSRSVEDAVKKLARLGIASAKGDFVTSSQATALYLLRAHPGRRLYICGTESLKAELHAHGFPIAGSWREAEAVVVGFDTELTFRKLEDVCRLLAARPELPYIATNPDLVCPVEFGSVPDCGSICAMLRNATGREPLVIGKPSPLMVELAMERWASRPAKRPWSATGSTPIFAAPAAPASPALRCFRARRTGRCSPNRRMCRIWCCKTRAKSSPI